jgi:hypothetical protein
MQKIPKALPSIELHSQLVLLHYALRIVSKIPEKFGQPDQ